MIESETFAIAVLPQITETITETCTETSIETHTDTYTQEEAPIVVVPETFSIAVLP